MRRKVFSSPPPPITVSLAAMIIGHVYFAVFIKKNWPDLKAMFTGTIPLEEYMRYHEIESE